MAMASPVWKAVAILILAIAIALVSKHSVENTVKDTKSLPCNIKRVKALTCEQFVNVYLGKEPVVFTVPGGEKQTEKFRHLTERDELISRHGDEKVKVSTANSYTGKVWSTITLKDYLETSTMQDRSKNGNETWYLFGGIEGEWADNLMHEYIGPNLPSETLLTRGSSRVDSEEKLCNRFQAWNPDGTPPRTDDFVTTSFGIAGMNTGVPFHFHGPGFLQVLHGAKRWFLYPPHNHVKFNPNATTIEWVEDEYPKIVESDGASPFKECVVHENEFIYFPDKWMHATLNLSQYTVFVASFA